MITEKVDYITRASRLHSANRLKPDTYTIHETQNFNATAQNERDNLQNNEGINSFHSVVDNKNVIRCVPFTTGCYHAGTWAGNSSSLSLEICSSSLQSNFAETWDNAVEVVAADLSRLGWGVNQLRQHYEWSGKDCPKFIRNNNLWEQFKKDVKDKMNEKKVESKCSFPDAQKWVKEKGISDGTNPKQEITREQVWAMMYRAFMKGAYK